MLLELDVANFAIIEALRVSFGQGLNVLTGETGAGKSILIDAVNALLGGRCGSELVRAGAEFARVEGIFDISLRSASAEGDHKSIATLVVQHDLVGDEGTLILSREIQRNGRTVARINGRVVPVSLLQQIGSALVDVHGQGDQQSLLRSSQHIEFLDHFAELLPLRCEYASKLTELKQVRRAIDGINQDERELVRRTDLLRYQVEQIREARLRVGEDDELSVERDLLANAAERAEAVQTVYDILKSSSNERTMFDLANEALRHMRHLARLDASVMPSVTILEGLSYQMEEVVDFLRGYRDGIEFSPSRLAIIEERLDLVRRLQRKYGKTIADILEFEKQAASELATITRGGERLAELEKREMSLSGSLERIASAMTEQRRAAADRLAEAVQRELGDLNMERTHFAVTFDRNVSDRGLCIDGTRYAYDATGVDQVEFVVAPNPGEPLRPLAKIASGGETARLMLALKTVLAAADGVSSLIFDEIDVGIGGRSGQILGMKLSQLSRCHQVLCVTHLPQIACFADDHFHIFKRFVDGRTITVVSQLSDGARVTELGTMLGGVAGNKAAEENATELLARALQHKRELATSAAVER